MKKRLLAGFIIGVLIFGIIAPANATLFSFTDRNTFENQLSNFQVLDFDDFFFRPLPSNYSYGDTILNANGGLFSSSYTGGNRVGAENGGILDIQLTEGHRAFGLDIGHLWDNSAQDRLSYTLFSGQDILFSNVNKQFTSDAPPVQSNGSFFGWISTDKDLTKLSLRVVVPYVSTYATIDNITYDLPNPSLTPVPEPTTSLLLWVGLVGLLGSQTRKTKVIQHTATKIRSLT